MGEPKSTPWDFTKALEDVFMNVDPPHIPSTPIHDYKLPDHLPTMDELWTSSVLAPPPTVHYYPQEPPRQPEEFIHKPITPIPSNEELEREEEIENAIVAAERSDVDDINGAGVEALESVPELPMITVEESRPSTANEDARGGPIDCSTESQSRGDIENMGCPRCGHPDGVIVQDESGLPLGVECPTCEPIYACQECGNWDYEGHLLGCTLK